MRVRYDAVRNTTIIEGSFCVRLARVMRRLACFGKNERKFYNNHARNEALLIMIRQAEIQMCCIVCLNK
jgi:hypothetical protein